MNVFQGCVDESCHHSVSAGAQFDYCGCFIKKVSQGMDFEELMTSRYRCNKRSKLEKIRKNRKKYLIKL